MAAAGCTDPSDQENLHLHQRPLLYGQLGGAETRRANIRVAAVGRPRSITPLPGGVGAMLLNTTLQAFERSAALSS